MSNNYVLQKIRMLMLLLLGTASAYAQQVVTGTVTDGNVPLPGVSVFEKGTTHGTQTDLDGKYSITVPEDAVLEFSFLGFITREVAVNGQPTLNVMLEKDTEQLAEVVVTGPMGIKREFRSIGYAVSSVKGEELTKAGATLNPVLALYGKASGVGVNVGSAGPMGGINIKIRGNNSLDPNSNTRPLFVVDGVIIQDSRTNMEARGYDPLNSFDYGTGINDINPQDIESVEILKGAKAAVLYGQEGANGVVLITTKSGRGTKGFGITASTQFSTERPVNYIEFQNQFGSGESQYDVDYETVDGQEVRRINDTRYSFGPRFDGEPIMYFDGSIAPYQAVEDNFMSMFRNGYTNTTQVAISGGNQNGNMRISYTNTNYQDILDNGRQNRHAISFNGSMKASEFASVDITTNLYNSKTHNRRPNISGIVAWGLNRDYSFNKLRDLVFTPDGYRADTEPLGLPTLANNLAGFWWEQDYNSDQDNRWNLISSAKVTLQFTPEFSFVGLAGLNYINTDFITKNKVTRVEPQISGGEYSFQRDNFTSQNYRGMLNFDKQFVGDFSLFATVGGVYRKENENNVYASTTGGLSFPGWYSLDAGMSWPDPNSPGLVRGHTRGANVLYGLFGSAQIGYKGKYYVELQGRNDWNSTLPPSNNSYFYPGVSLTWNFSDDITIPYMNFGKFRVGWADVGKGSPSNYFAYRSYQVGKIAEYDDALDISGPGTLFAGELKPERKREYEVGFDTYFFEKNRLEVSFSYYTNNIYDQIVGVPLNAATGYDEIRINAGNVKNWGYELYLRGTPLITEQLRWNVSFTAANQLSEVKELYPGIRQKFLNGNSGFRVIAEEGHPINDIQMYDYKYDDQGNKVVAGNGLYQLDDELKTVGNANPKFLGGFTTDLNYKGLSLYLGFDYKFGGTIFSYSNYYLTGNGVTKNTLKYRDEANGGMAYYINEQNQKIAWEHDRGAPAESADGHVYHDGLILDGVKEVQENGATSYAENDIIISAREYYSSYINDLSTSWPPDRLFKNDYIKLREVALSYTLPTSFTSKIKVQRMTLSLAARNLFYLHKTIPNVDVESSLGIDSYIENSFYPAVRTFSLGLNVSF